MRPKHASACFSDVTKPIKGKRNTHTPKSPIVFRGLQNNLAMEFRRRIAYDSAFKLKAIDLAAEVGNRAAAVILKVSSESMIRRWKLQHHELLRCKKTKKAFRGNKSRWPELEDALADWVKTQRARGLHVGTAQMRMKAKAIARENNAEGFTGGASWCVRFMRRKGLTTGTPTTLCQQLSHDSAVALANFHTSARVKIAENSIGPERIVNMMEVPLSFDLPRIRNQGVDSSSACEKTRVTCVLSCSASGQKLPPMVIFKRMVVPKGLPRGVLVKVSKRGWMRESQMMEWLMECYSKRAGGLSPHTQKALLVLDISSFHVTASVRAAVRRTNSIPVVIPRGATCLQPLDGVVNGAFKAALRAEWRAWKTSEEMMFTKSGRVRRAFCTRVCQWIHAAWDGVGEAAIVDGFRKAGFLRDEGDPSAGCLRGDLIRTLAETLNQSTESLFYCNGFLGLKEEDPEENPITPLSASVLDVQNLSSDSRTSSLLSEQGAVSNFTDVMDCSPPAAVIKDDPSDEEDDEGLFPHLARIRCVKQESDSSSENKEPSASEDLRISSVFSVRGASGTVHNASVLAALSLSEDASVIDSLVSPESAVLLTSNTSSAKPRDVCARDDISDLTRRSQKNKALMCRPATEERAVQCRPMLGTGMDKTGEKVRLVPVPIPIPIFIPVPVHLPESSFQLPVPGSEEEATKS